MLLLQCMLCSNSFGCVGKYTREFGVAWWDPIPSVGEISGGWTLSVWMKYR